jgi:hypothetical protein
MDATKLAELKEVTETAKSGSWADVFEFHALASPQAILELIAEVERLRGENEAMRKATPKGLGGHLTIKSPYRGPLDFD